MISVGVAGPAELQQAFFGADTTLGLVLCGRELLLPRGNSSRSQGDPKGKTCGRAWVCIHLTDPQESLPRFYFHSFPRKTCCPESEAHAARIRERPEKLALR